MRPIRIEDHTRALAKDQDEFLTLYIRDVETEHGNVMYSVWEPSPKELEILKTGGTIRIGILGTRHPPVMVDVQPPPPVWKT